MPQENTTKAPPGASPTHLTDPEATVFALVWAAEFARLKTTLSARASRYAAEDATRAATAALAAWREANR